MSTFTAKVVLGSGIFNAQQFNMLPFWLIENQHGKFVLNWSVVDFTDMKEGLEFEHRKMPSFARVKYSQLTNLRAPWLKDNPLMLQQVVPGAVQTVQEKIRDICIGTTGGQRVLVGLLRNTHDKYFLDALGVNRKKPDPNSGIHIKDTDLTVSDPFCVYPKLK